MLGVLSAYAMLDPEIGYTQGMNFLVGLLLAFLPRAADAFGALVLLMQERRLRDLYKPDMSLLQVGEVSPGICEGVIMGSDGVAFADTFSETGGRLEI